jgi:hypothetical protein
VATHTRGNVSTFPNGEPANPRGFKFSNETDSPYLNPEQAARYLQLFIKDETTGLDTDVPNVRAFYQYVKRHGITKLRVGRCLRVDRRELDAAIRPVKSARHTRRFA